MKKLKFTAIQYLLVLSSIFILLFIISLILFHIDNNDHVRIVLFFPDKFTGKLIGEERYIKNEKNYEDKIKALVCELLLGPSLPGSSPIFSRNTEIISTLLDKKHLFINFSKEIIFPDIKIPLDFYTGLQACINSLKFNFPSIKNISFYVNGEIVTPKPGVDSEQEKENAKIKFITDLLK